MVIIPLKSNENHKRSHSKPNSESKIRNSYQYHYSSLYSPKTNLNECEISKEYLRFVMTSHFLHQNIHMTRNSHSYRTTEQLTMDNTNNFKLLKKMNLHMKKWKFIFYISKHPCNILPEKRRYSRGNSSFSPTFFQ